MDAELCSDNISKFYLPVSIKDNDFAKNNSYERLSKNNFNKIILQMTPDIARDSDLILKEYQNLNDDINETKYI